MGMGRKKRHYRKSPNKVQYKRRKWYYNMPSTTIQPDLDWRKMRQEGKEGWYSAYLHTRHWHNIRKQVFERDNYTCTRCGSREFLEAHHLSYLNLGNELLTDLTTLCRNCHREIHKGKNEGY